MGPVVLGKIVFKISLLFFRIVFGLLCFVLFIRISVYKVEFIQDKTYDDN